MEILKEISTQELQIRETHAIVSVEVVQLDKVQLQLESDHGRETIKAELFTSYCKDNLPCHRLAHNVLHTDAQSFVTFSVLPENQDQRYIMVGWMLATLMSCVLLTWLIRRWLKRKYGQQEPSKNLPTQEELSSAKDFDTKSKEIQLNQNDSVPANQRVSQASFKMTMIRNFQASKQLPVILSSSIVICMFVFGMLLIFGSPEFHQDGNKPVLKLTFPGSKHIRHIRSYTEDPDIKDVQLNKDNTGSNLVTRLQLLELSTDCRNNLTGCRAHALCDTGSAKGSLKCRCNRGFYLKDLTCLPCKTTCGDGFFMKQQCGAERDVVCQPCSQCEGSLYEVATCTSTQDTICLDVSFPLKQFPASRSLPVADLVRWNVSMSKNVFLERLQGIKKLETSSLYLLSNKQAVELLWRRSGLEINVRASGIYLIPEYVDIDHTFEDDMPYIEKAANFPDDLKNQLKVIASEHCRSPMPDEYDLHLQIAKDTTTVALENVCGYQNRIPCPPGYKDGDSYIFQFLDRPCPKVQGKSEVFSRNPNNILCSGNTDILKSVFNMEVDDTTFLNFPSEECDDSRKGCGRCLSREACDRGSNLTDCCNLDCHQRDDCKKYFSHQCPERRIECSRGDITKFGIMPRYQSIEKNIQFSCHLRHKPPKYFYQLSYEVSIPSMQFSLGMRYKDILYRNFTDVVNGSDEADFLRMTHHTESKFDDEVILIGRFKNSNPRQIEEYTLHKVKDSHTFDRFPGYNIQPIDLNTFRTKVQFESPFLYSTETWKTDSCWKNVSKIYPAQPVYRNYGRTVKLRDKIKKQNHNKRNDYNFTYQILSDLQGTTPEMKFFIPENMSILSYYKDAYRSVRVNPWDLRGNMRWDSDTHHWNITVSGSLTACPGIFNLEIYTANMDSCLASYDMLINCPQEFFTSFEIKQNSVDFIDIFVIVMNDSVSSYRIVLSSVQGPQYFISSEKSDVTIDTGEDKPWTPMIVILAVCFCASIVLVMIYAFCDQRKKRFIPSEIRVPKPDLGPDITLLESIDKVKKDQDLSLHTKFIIMTLVLLYVAYALTFTFTALFALFHLVQGPSLAKITLATNTSDQVQYQMERTLDRIQQHENTELGRLLKLTEQRLSACNHHLKNSLYDSIPVGNHELRQILQDLFRKNGTVNKKVAEYFNNRQDFYQTEIDKFLDEFNRTLDTKLTRLQFLYALYLKDIAENTWFTFPKEIYMQQRIIEGFPMNEITDDLTGFLTWLEIDKVQELFEMKDLIMGRLLKKMPRVDFSKLANDTEESDKASVNLDFKSLENTFRFSANNPEQNPARPSFTSNTEPDKTKPSRSKVNMSNIKGIIYPVFICVFLVLDSFLLIYRFSWMMKSLKLFKSGLEERIPCDSITRQIYFILTGKLVSRADSTSNYPFNMLNKEDIWSNNTGQYFMYCAANPKEKEKILIDLLQSQQDKTTHQIVSHKRKQEHCCLRYFKKVIESTYSLLISPVFWRFLLISGFMLTLFLVAKATNDLVTIESAMFLLDTGAMLPILERQNDITNTVIFEYNAYLNKFLLGFKDNMDGEVQSINGLLLNVAERQNMLLNTMISDLCNLAGVDNCPEGTNLVTVSVTSCNFLPVHSKLFEGFHQTTLLEYIQAELSPLVLNLRSIMFSSVYLLLACAVAMLLSQIIARVIFIHLKNSKHTKISKIYQLPSTYDHWQDAQSLHEKEMYNSQSVIAESCESGVYDLTNENI